MSRDWDEYHLVEKRALDLFQELDYQVYDVEQGDSIPHRESKHQVLLLDKLRESLRRINPWLNENNLNKAVNQIRPAKIQATNLMDANEKVYEKLVQHISLQQDLGKGKKNQTVKYIDYNNPENNEFIALNQYTVQGKEKIRTDITVFINGLPIAVIECKNESTCNQPEEEAINQLQRYQDLRDYEADEGAEKLFYTNQFLVAAWGPSASAAPVGTPARHFREWKDPYPHTRDEIEELTDKEPNLQDILLFSIFKKENLLDLMQNFTVFEQEGNTLVKKTARYQQFRAVNKALDRIQTADSLADRNGTVWHTQGSGKSLSMLFLALKLRRMKELNNPTLLIVTDRVDLDRQITATFERCGFPNPKSAGGVEDLREKIKYGSGKTIMTTIHKFQLTAEEQNENKKRARSEEKIKYPVLNESENIFVMVDEAHRTQYKDLAFNMRRAMPNACYLGFTGTPIEKEERSTTRTFGGYIDTYTIEESVEDGATLPIKYEGRLPELKVEGNDLDEIFERAFADYSDEEKAEIKKKYATTQAIAEAPRRIEKICLDIINHWEEKIAPLKAQIVTTSRRAVAIYKEKLDELNAPQSIAIFSSGSKNDPPLIKKHHTPKDKQKQLIERFKKPDDPIKFLIVCDKLLTGFDAPVEQVMYLDKPLKEHNLLQAIARVNRRFENKNFGLIVDYYGGFDNLQEALAIFNEEDVENAATPVKDEEPRLQRRYRRVMRLFDGLNLDDLEECVLAFEDEDKRMEFKEAFKVFSESMDIVMPDPIADPYRDDLKTLAKVYRAVRNRYRDKSINVKGLGAKIRKIIDDHIQVSDISLLHEPVSILDEDKFDQVIKEKDKEEAKASEMEHAIRHTVNVKMEENPVFYQSLKERLEEIIEKQKQGRFDFTEKIEAMRGIINKMRNVRTKAEKLGLNEKEFALYELLEEESKTDNDSSEAVAEDRGEYEVNDDAEFKGNKELKELAQELMENLKEMAVVDWKKKQNKVLKPMKRMIMRKLYQYEKFRDDLDSLTTQIMKLAKNIL
ncbi:type I restriction endonuclease subunit R [Halanaerobacter jeridensis]|uniref:Type I restriction enzyme endonuclease subunit n=1 Tax=Halanaerobacter jeridensis TaxID=706427 RepID=A0A939BPB9_9FIRM|nr:type I restriction endonuclease subunit R [Halanaerobacter jeridensis]MBM7556837.1 type I restriction enzyme R subunit [Halanaerobacter jeridensis]